MKKIISRALVTSLIITGFFGFSPESLADHITPQATAASTNFYTKVKCPVMKINNQATGDYIYATGKDKAAAVKSANTILGQKYGPGYKLKHCRDLGRFSGGGGSGSWSITQPYAPATTESAITAGNLSAPVPPMTGR